MQAPPPKQSGHPTQALSSIQPSPEWGKVADVCQKKACPFRQPPVPEKVWRRAPSEIVKNQRRLVSPARRSPQPPPPAQMSERAVHPLGIAFQRCPVFSLLLHRSWRSPPPEGAPPFPSQQRQTGCRPPPPPCAVPLQRQKRRPLPSHPQKILESPTPVKHPAFPGRPNALP